MRIPITFTHKNKTYSGYFRKVVGAADSETWYLMIDNYYYGRLRFKDKWIFDSSKIDMSDMADFFGEWVKRS